MENNNKLFLKTGAFVERKYRKLLVSGIMMWLVTLVDSNADTFIAGIYINEAAVSGVELVSPFFSILTFFAYLIAMGTALMYSRECGAFNYERADGIVGQGIICSAITSVILVIAMIVLREPLMNYYSPSDQVLAYANEYYTFQMFFAVLYPIFYVFSQLVIIDGDEVVPVAATITMAVANLAASLLLVKSYGVKGLALGTAIGAAFGFAVYCLHFTRKTNSIRVKWHFSFRDVSEMMKLSSTTAITLLYTAVIDIVMNKFVITHFTDAYLPAYAVINFVLNLGAVFSSTFDSASGFISVGYGEKNPKSINKVMRFATSAVLIESVIALIVMEFVASAMPGYYGISNPEVAKAAVQAARIVSISFPAIGLYYLYCAYYPAIDHVLLGNITTAIYMLITPICVAMPLGEMFGFDGLCWGFMLTSVIAIAITCVIIRIKHGKGAVPLIPIVTDEDSLAYDFYLSEESIAALCESVRDELNRRHVDSSVTNEVQLILEESYMTIMENNSNRKVITECNLLISDKRIRLITRDNGNVFDITDANAKVKSLRGYVLAQLMERNPERSNTTTVSFNRNSYLWPLDTSESSNNMI